MKIIYIPSYTSGAGRWIYDGYDKAWRSKGFEVRRFSSLVEINGSDYYLMATCSMINHHTISRIKQSHKTFLFTQPTSFPMPWGSHDGWRTTIDRNLIPEINSMSNVVLWSFVKPVKEFYSLWDNVVYVPLAFDDFTYKFSYDDRCNFDICFVGGWANNGFNEKRKIMIEHFDALKKTGLKCGIFINKNISQELENKILSSSKISLNIHDAYQRTLGLDSNERTYKSLGLNGILLCDKIDIIEKDKIPVRFYSSIPQLIEETIRLSKRINDEEREFNKNYILQNHCYTNRVEQFLGSC